MLSHEKEDTSDEFERLSKGFPDPDPNQDKFVPNPDLIPRPRLARDFRFNKPNPQAEKRWTAVDAGVSHNYGGSEGNTNPRREINRSNSLDALPNIERDSMPVLSRSIQSIGISASDTRIGANPGSNKGSRRDKAVDLSKGWPAPTRRGSGLPRETMLPSSFQGSAILQQIPRNAGFVPKPLRSDTTSRSPDRQASEDAELPLYNPNGTLTFHGQVQAELGNIPDVEGEYDPIMDDELLATRLQEEEYAADLDSMTQSQSENHSGNTQYSGDDSLYVRVKKTKQIQEWEKYLKVDNPAQVPDLIGMDQDKFDRYYVKVESAYEPFRAQVELGRAFKAFQLSEEKRFGISKGHGGDGSGNASRPRDNDTGGSGRVLL